MVTPAVIELPYISMMRIHLLSKARVIVGFVLKCPQSVLKACREGPKKSKLSKVEGVSVLSGQWWPIIVSFHGCILVAKFLGIPVVIH